MRTILPALAILAACSTSPDRPDPVPCVGWGAVAEGRTCEPVCADRGQLRLNDACTVWHDTAGPFPVDIKCDAWTDADGGGCCTWNDDKSSLVFYPGADICID